MDARLVLLAVPLAVATSSCSLLDGMGGDGSRLEVTSECSVDLRQHAQVAGKDSSDVVEAVKVSPDCTVEVDFKESVGEG